jgi:hypothetical protein
MLKPALMKPGCAPGWRGDFHLVKVIRVRAEVKAGELAAKIEKAASGRAVLA